MRCGPCEIADTGTAEEQMAERERQSIAPAKLRYMAALLDIAEGPSSIVLALSIWAMG